MPSLPLRPLLALIFLVVSSLEAGPMGLVLPTDNDAIFSSDPSQFYMYTDRNFEGVVSKPWSGGAYGFTRNQKRTAAGIVMTRLHEGIDIRPVRRDASGEPLDEVRSISNGTVVYVSDSPSASNYGRYIVVHHDWGTGPFFSLYAHHKSADVAAGPTVRAGETIGKMGYTGAGINRERAHVHVEDPAHCEPRSPRFLIAERPPVWGHPRECEVEIALATTIGFCSGRSWMQELTRILCVAPARWAIAVRALK
jgi:murein DD-endopeptidase MepM/ murein hydrolase activator NlpD